MGEEKKNPEDEKKPEDEKQKKRVPESDNKPKDDKPLPPPSPSPSPQEDNPKPGGEDSIPDEAPPPPLPPPEIVLRVYMHCEGCARKVRRCLKGFNGVEEVTTDCKTHTVVVKGEKADPLKVVERVQKKTHRQVELLSPIPKPPPPAEEKEVEEKEAPKTEDKREEPKVVTVVLKVHMHCEACALEIKKRIEKMKEVEEAAPDLKNSQVTVKGTFDPAKLVEYVYKRTGKHAIIVKQDPPEKNEDDKGQDGKEEKKGQGEEGKGKGEEKGSEEEGKGGNAKGRGEDGKEAPAGSPEEEGEKVELMRNEYYYYPPRYGMEMYAYPPQMFSDENPNACSIM